MNFLRFQDIKQLSRNEILYRINKTKKDLIFLYFQGKIDSNSNFKNHQIKFTKRYLRQLNTVLTYQDKLLKN